MVGFFIILICIVLGIFAGLNLEVPYTYAKYISVAIVACMDSALGAFIANLKKDFKFSVFLTGFFGNAIITIVLVYLGEKLDVDLYLGAVIVFTSRILNNISNLRRMIIDKFQRKKCVGKESKMLNS